MVGYTLLVVAVSVTLGMMTLALIPMTSPDHERGPKDDIRLIVTFMIARRTGGADRVWPAYNGKNFVLSVVATNDLDRRRRENLELLFPRSGYPEGLALDAYDDVNKSSLRTRRFPRLTEIAGRRNTHPMYRITEHDEKHGTPIMAVRVSDGVIIGYSSGEVRLHDRSELELGADEPIHFGDKAKSDLLRCLSEE